MISLDNTVTIDVRDSADVCRDVYYYAWDTDEIAMAMERQGYVGSFTLTSCSSYSVIVEGNGGNEYQVSRDGDVEEI